MVHFISDVNKDWTHKYKDQAFKDNNKDKELTDEDKDKFTIQCSTARASTWNKNLTQLYLYGQLSQRCRRQDKDFDLQPLTTCKLQHKCYRQLGIQVQLHQVITNMM